MRTRAPCSSAIFFTTARPRPVPFALVVTYGSKARFSTFSAKPGPLSMHRCRRTARTSPLSLRAASVTTRTRPSGRSATASSAFCTQVVDHLAQLRARRRRSRGSAAAELGVQAAAPPAPAP